MNDIWRRQYTKLFENRFAKSKWSGSDIFCIFYEAKTVSGAVFTIIVLDEEIGGFGMKPLVKMQEFKDLNIGFALDEGKYTIHTFFSMTLHDTIKVQMTKIGACDKTVVY